MTKLFRNSSEGALTREQAFTLEKKRHEARTQEAKRLAAAGRGNDTEVAHVARGELVVPQALQNPEVLQAIARAAQAQNIPLGMLRVGNRQNSINPNTGVAEFGIGAGRSDIGFVAQNPYPPAKLPGEIQTSLNRFEKSFITDEMRDGVKGTLRGLTNNALPPAQVDGIYNQLIDNISRGDAIKLAPIDPGQKPLTLTPQQKAIIESQINQLKPEDRDAVHNHYNGMIKEGGIVCPSCGK